MDLRRAVFATVSYSRYFHFPLLPAEVHHWLICSHPISYSKLLPFLPDNLSKAEISLRDQVSKHSHQKKLHAQKLTRLLEFVPGLRLVALTGSVAAINSHEEDDIDLLFITAPHTLWLVRPLVIILISLFFRRRHPNEDHSHTQNAFCPNLWLDTLSITLPVSKRSLYTAHEVLQIVPLLDRYHSYSSFIRANRWTKKYLANAYPSSLRGRQPAYRQAGLTPAKYPFSLLLAPFNYLSYLIQLLYMFPKKTTETVHLHAAFLHTTDFTGRLNSHLKEINNI